MTQEAKADQICGNAECRHTRQQHKDGKGCTDFLATEVNVHGEVEAADEECRCPYFHEDERDYRKHRD